jgi:hypothetical protein
MPSSCLLPRIEVQPRKAEHAEPIGAWRKPSSSGQSSRHSPVRREVRAGEGSWFIRATLPYRRSNGSGVEGVVITFVDISEIKNR